MARRHGPQLRNLMYDRASAADDLMRLEAADSHQGPERDRSSKRPDRFVHPVPPAPTESPCGGRRVTPSAVSEHVSELLGCPISRSLTASCVGLELRPLPSTGITRLQRYYWPLRHPSAPGLSLTGVRLIIPDHAVGFPVLRALSLCTCCRHTPVQRLGVILAHLTQPYQPSPIRRSG